MKKIICFNLSLVLLLLCGCAEQENKDTRFLLDTVVTLRAACDRETLDGAFELCKNYEQMLSRTITDSDVYTLNNSDGFVEVNSQTASIIKQAVHYGKISNGKFDITIYPVSSLWDWNNEIVPSKDEISEALKNVDYQSIEFDGNKINLNGKKIDLGGIAKGFIADKVLQYFKDNNIPEGIIDLGGNIVVFGERDYTVGIKKPFSNGELAASIRLCNKTVVTSGTYERYIPCDVNLYHHILDPDTGYACATNLTSATIIADSSMKADAYSTICILLGLEKATEFIEKDSDTEAVFIDLDGNLHYTSGLSLNEGEFTLK